MPRWILGSNSGETFPNKFCSTGCKGHLLEKVLNRFQLIALTIMVPLADAPFFLEILSQNAMTCAKLKQLSITRHGIHEGFQWIGGSFIHKTFYKWWNSVSDFHMVFYNLMLHIINWDNCCCSMLI